MLLYIARPRAFISRLAKKKKKPAKLKAKDRNHFQSLLLPPHFSTEQFCVAGMHGGMAAAEATVLPKLLYQLF